MARQPGTGVETARARSVALAAWRDNIFAGSASAKQQTARASLAVACVLAGCILWLLALAKIGAAIEALPWYLCIAAVGAICAQRATRRALRAAEPVLLKLGGREPLSLLETWAITYLFTAFLLYASIEIHAALPKPQSKRAVQFVDIQLISNRDFANRNSPLAGTQEQPELHKRQADKITRQGSFNAEKVAPVAQKGKPEQQKAETAQRNSRSKEQARNSVERPQRNPAKQVVAVRATQGVAPTAIQNMEADDMVLVKPAPASASAPAHPKPPAKGKADNTRPYIEEVQPPELVEMIENDGNSRSPNVFEAGGSSNGGTGAANDLNGYLKQLHKRIKSTWSPPRGQSHKAAVLFRIRKDGRLAFIKLINSSGDYPTDDAAVRAIAASVKGYPLPVSSALPYLDVQYTFNYSVDELKEVPSNSLE